MCLCLLRTIPVQQKLYRKLKRIHKWSLSNVQATFNLSYWVFDTEKGLEIFTSIRFRERPYTLKYRAKVSEYTIKYFICYAYSTFKRVLTQYTINHKETIIDNMYALLFITGIVFRPAITNCWITGISHKKGFLDGNEVSLHHQNPKAESEIKFWLRRKQWINNVKVLCNL